MNKQEAQGFKIAFDPFNRIECIFLLLKLFKAIHRYLILAAR